MNIDALQALYQALGGSLTDYYSDIADGIPVSDYNISADVILAIAKVAATAVAAELPTVTSSDNGKVLTVDGGKWKAKALPE